MRPGAAVALPPEAAGAGAGASVGICVRPCLCAFVRGSVQECVSGAGPPCDTFQVCGAGLSLGRKLRERGMSVYPSLFL